MEIVYRVDTANAERALLVARRALVAGGSALGQGAVLIQRDAVRLAPKADGTLHRNIQMGRISLIVYEIVSRSAHGAYVERGTGSYGPLRRFLSGHMSREGIERIAAWIKRKGIRARSVPQSALPFVIARKIAHYGTKAQPHMEPALEKNRGRIQELVRDAILRSLRPVFL